MDVSYRTGFTGSRIRIFSALLVVGVVGLSGCSSATPGTPQPPSASVSRPAPAPALAAPFKTTDNYTIAPPAGWIYHPTDKQGGISSIFGAPTLDPSATNPFVDNINVVITPATKTLDDIVAQTKQAYPGYLTNYRVVIDEATTADGRPAHLLGGAYDDAKAGKLRNLQIILLDQGKQYTITFTATADKFDGLRAVAEASLRSFTLL